MSNSANGTDLDSSTLPTRLAGPPTGRGTGIGVKDNFNTMMRMRAAIDDVKVLDRFLPWLNVILDDCRLPSPTA